jgi:glycosyltransferase involved in cell wall biosynthesis
MRVLVVHNRYASALPSGENRVIDTEVEALAEAGVEVETYFRSSDEIEEMGHARWLAAAVSPLLGIASRNSFRQKLSAFNPDVVHLHNPYPLISPWAIEECASRGTPVVATIHNFRLRCINSLFFRDGRICTECEFKRLPSPGIVHGCYRGSRAQSAVMATALTIHRPTWRRVARFIAVSEFVADRLVGWGVDRSRIVVKPNPVRDPGPVGPVGSGFLFAGRVSVEKGISLLLDAWELSALDGHFLLRIAGSGPLSDVIASRASTLRSVEVRDHVDASSLEDLIRSSAVGVLPSIWFETHGSVAEFFALGRPVVVTRIGALGSAVDEMVGWKADPTPQSLAEALRRASDRSELEIRGAGARRRFEDRYRSDVVIQQLITLYERVMQDAR